MLSEELADDALSLAIEVSDGRTVVLPFSGEALAAKARQDQLRWSLRGLDG